MRAKVALGLVRTAEGDARRRQRARHTATEWARIVTAQRRSKLTIVEYCRRRDIALATFGYWRRRLVQAAAVAQPVQRFLAVPLVAPVAAPIEVELGTLRVRVAGAAAARVIDALVARIGGEATR
jgi:transposase-like protein